MQRKVSNRPTKLQWSDLPPNIDSLKDRKKGSKLEKRPKYYGTPIEPFTPRFRSIALDQLVKIREQVELAVDIDQRLDKSTSKESDSQTRFYFHPKVVDACLTALSELANTTGSQAEGSVYRLVENIMRHNVYQFEEEGGHRLTYDILQERTEQLHRQREAYLNIKAVHECCEDLILDLQRKADEKISAQQELQKKCDDAVTNLASKSLIIEDLTREIEALNNRRVEMRQKINDMEHLGFKAMLEKIAAEREAEKARQESSELMRAQDSQRRLLAKANYDPSHISSAVRREWKHQEDEDDIYAQLERTLAQRDDLQYRLDQTELKVHRLTRTLQRENQTKNVYLQQRAYFKDELGKMTADYKNAMAARTPRPQWNNIMPKYPKAQQKCFEYLKKHEYSRQEEDASKPQTTPKSRRQMHRRAQTGVLFQKTSSSDRIGVIIQALENEASECERLTRYVKLGLGSDKPASQKIESQHSNSKSTCRYLFCLGDNVAVPIFLRATGKVRNLHWDRKKVEQFVQQIWDLRRSASDRQSSYSSRKTIPDVINDLFHVKFTFAKERVEAAYNFMDGLERFRWFPECNMMYEIIGERLNEGAYDDTIRLLDAVEKQFDSMVQRTSRTRQTGTVSKSGFLEVIMRFFPMKSRDERQELKTALNADVPGFHVDFQLLKSMNPSLFIDTIINQHVHELIQYQEKFRSKVLAQAYRKTESGTDSTRQFVHLSAVRDVMQEIDVSAPENAAELFLMTLQARGSRGRKSVMSSKSLKDQEWEAHDIIEKVVHRQLLKPSQIYVIPDDLDIPPETDGYLVAGNSSPSSLQKRTHRLASHTSGMSAGSGPRRSTLISLAENRSSDSAVDNAEVKASASQKWSRGRSKLLRSRSLIPKSKGPQPSRSSIPNQSPAPSISSITPTSTRRSSRRLSSQRKSLRSASPFNPPNEKSSQHLGRSSSDTFKKQRRRSGTSPIRAGRRRSSSLRKRAPSDPASLSESRESINSELSAMSEVPITPESPPDDDEDPNSPSMSLVSPRRRTFAEIDTDMRETKSQDLFEIKEHEDKDE